MDKFAVDLDQVLNDFEYSELTEHFNTATQSYHKNPTQIHQNNGESSTIHGQFNNTNSTISKHSITNVFNSLSEYLNTDITPKYNNSLSENEEVIFNNDQNTATELKLNDVNNSENEQSQIENNYSEAKEETNELLEIDKSVEEIPQVVANLIQVDDEIDAKLEETEISNEINEEEKGDVKENTQFSEEIAEDESDKGEHVNVQFETDLNQPEIEQEEVIVEVEAIEEKPIVQGEQNAEEKTPEAQCVGFIDDLNLDDSEINNAFAELEAEFETEPIKNIEETVTEESKNNECEKEIVVEEKLETKKDTACKVEQTVVEEVILERPQDLLVNNDNFNESKRKINLIGDPGSTPYNNVYIDKEIGTNRNKNENIDHSDDEDSTSTTFSEESLDSACTVSTASTEAVTDDINDKDKVPNNVENANQTENVENVQLNENDTNYQTENADENALRTETDTNEGAAALEPNIDDEKPLENTENMSNTNDNWLGKQAPLWVPDSDTISCLHCDMKFTVLKRRHHCRACGLVLCSKCCNLRFRLDYLDQEARVCNKCYDILNNKEFSSSSGSEMTPESGNSPAHHHPNRPNPNNPLEYCSTVSPLQQIDASTPSSLPAVMVPVGVLKREGSTKQRGNKSVIFCDGIRPGSDLTNLDTDFNYNNNNDNNTATSTGSSSGTRKRSSDENKSMSMKSSSYYDAETHSFIPKDDNMLPPVVRIFKTDFSYSECVNDINTVNTLKDETLTFAIQLNLYVHVKIINMDCCINKIAWCFSTEGLINVGQDEIVILLEILDNESVVPKDIFYHLNNIYFDAVKGTSVKETGCSLHVNSIFLDSKNHAGFIYIRPTFECLRNVIIPKESYLVGILIHRWEIPWAKLFPLRLILRLGAEFRYYPCPIISVRHRDSVFVEVGHTIINLLADFRNFTYTLPQIRGLTIHMEDKKTTINIPMNRYDQVMKSINNSSDHILAFAGNFSLEADSHLVCIQDTQGNENNYTTHAINIHNKPRKITGASFIVFNGALKSSSGLTAKSNIVEDGLMIQILPEHMLQIRENLRNMKNHTIQCGCVNAATDETVYINWIENDTNFNVGVVSPIDGKSMNGIPSIRVHNGKDYMSNSKTRLIRWTEAFLIQNGEELNNSKNKDPVDISKVSESIAKAACNALVKYLDLLASNNFYKIGIRITLHVENVSYAAGSNNMKLPPIYMKSLDNELVPIVHRITTNNFGDNIIVLELILRILNM